MSVSSRKRKKQPKKDNWQTQIDEADREQAKRYLPAKKRWAENEMQSLAEDTYVMERLSQGASIQQVAREAGITRATVYKKMKQVAKDFMANAGEMALTVKIAQDEQLAHIYEQALEAWHKSKEDIVDKDGNIIRQSPGDIKYLDAARRALKDINDLWGASAPVRVMHATVRIQDETEQLTRDNPERMKQIYDLAKQFGLVPNDEVDIVEGSFTESDQQPRHEESPPES